MDKPVNKFNVHVHFFSNTLLCKRKEKISWKRDERTWLDLGPDTEMGNRQKEMAFFGDGLMCSQHEEDLQEKHGEDQLKKRWKNLVGLEARYRNGQ